MLTTNKNDCTGCYACFNACPVHCISMELDNEGFRQPVIDHEKCIKCGKCQKICQQAKENAQRNKNHTASAYICIAKDKDIRVNSATSGVCFLLGQNIIEEKGGCVFGVIGDMVTSVFHQKCNTVSQLTATRNSKYLQSQIGSTYQEAKTELENGRTVLFTGTPCQIGGLYGFLGKEYENLYTIDVICHGVPSEKVFRQFIRETEEKQGQKVISYFRDLTSGWRPSKFAIRFEDGSIDQVGSKCIYNRAFSTNLIQRRSCYSCSYAQIPRTADISVGDYFQPIDNIDYNTDNTGVSLVTVNSDKGRKLLSQLDNINISPIDLSKVCHASEHLAKPPKKNIYRRTFLKSLEKHSYSQAARIWLPRTTVGKMFRRIWGIFCYVWETLHGGFPMM